MSDDEPIEIRQSEPTRVSLSRADNNASSNQRVVIEWGQTSKNVSARGINIDSRAMTSYRIRNRSGGPITSQSEPATTFDSAKNRLILLTTANDGTTDNRLKISTLRSSGNQWTAEDERWLVDNGATTTDRPSIAFDSRPSSGVQGRYLIAFRKLA